MVTIVGMLVVNQSQVSGRSVTRTFGWAVRDLESCAAHIPSARVVGR